MFNFLPIGYKKRAKREYNFRLWTIAFVLFSIVSLASCALAVPAYIAASNHYKQALSEETQASGAIESDNAGSAATVVQKVSSYIAAAQSLTPLSADTIVEPIVSARPSGVVVTSISVNSASGQIIATVAGVAGTRDELIAFQNALQGIAQFGNVNLPVSYLAQDSNINYSIAVTLKNTK